MTEREAGNVLAVVMAGSARPDREKEDLLFLRRYLLPLPYGPVLRRVEEHVAGAGGGDTRWITTPKELLDACGLPEKVRHEVIRAVREGGTVEPDLRSIEGWSYVAPGAPKPKGVLEAAAVAQEAGAPAPIPALPAPSTALPGVLGGMVTDLAKAKRVPPARPERKGPSPAHIEAELAAADARFRAEYERAKRAEAGEELQVEDLIPY